MEIGMQIIVQTFVFIQTDLIEITILLIRFFVGLGGSLQLNNPLN